MPKSANRRRPIRRRRRKSINPPSSAVVYSGPISVGSRAKQNQRTFTTSIRYYSSISSDGSGVLNTVIGNAPSSCVDWSNFAGNYDEYRTLGIKIHYQPWNIYNKSTASTIQAILTCEDNDSGGALASYNAVAAYESAVLRSVEHPFTITWKMSGTTQSGFITTASPTANGWIKLFGNTFPNSFSLGSILVEFLVQFRGQN